MKKIAAQWLLLAFMATPAGRAFSQSSTAALNPVLVVFCASLSGNKEVRLTWTVQQQFVTDVFDIEKSTDGLHWAAIFIINATGFSSKPVSYTTSDDMPIKGSNLYRVRISSMDGSRHLYSGKKRKCRQPGCYQALSQSFCKPCNGFIGTGPEPVAN
jgi:hypothetical protein